MTAAVEAAQGRATPPHELKVAWYCHEYQSLPETGGALDQDARLMRIMQVLSNVYNVLRRVDDLSATNPHNIHQLTDSERRVLRWLKDEGLWLT